MSSLSSLSFWSRTMSTMTTTSDTSTSAPHTASSSSSVVTGLKASLGTGPFFHAHLQEGQRIEDVPAGVRYKVSTYAIGPHGVVSAGSLPQKPKKASVACSTCEELPRVSQRHSKERLGSGTDGSSAYFTSTPTTRTFPLRPSGMAGTRSASATAMSSDNTDFWTMVAEAHAPVNGSTPVPRRYHYITRSQSASAAPNAGHIQSAPKMHKQIASYSPGIGTPAYHESIESAPAASTDQVAWCPTRGRYLSPIEEVQFFPEKQGDSASLHSTTSAQSNLFIHRSVRRTPSASTFNSGYSATPRSPDDLTSPHGTGPSRSHGQSRPVGALPVIPASPRESQNVFEQEPVSLEEASLAFPMPVVYSSQVDYSPYEHPDEQDLGETLSTLRFANPHYHSGCGAMEEQDLADGVNPRASMPHSRTPSLLSRSESVRTELTYLTAQDSATNSRRASATPPDDLEAGRRQRSPLADADTTLVNTPRPSPAARLKASIDTLLSKSPKMRKSPGGIPNTPTADAASTFSVSPKVAKLFSQMHEGLKKHAPWGEGKGKPAEVLFWTGFLAPWCWLIGGWMLARSGETVAEGLPNGAKEPDPPLHSASSFQLQLRQKRPREIRVIPVNISTEKPNTEQTSIWRAAKNSSVELLESLRAHGKQSQDNALPSTIRAIALYGDVPIPIMITTRVDPWVVRCRVAAVVSGMFILALCIVALIVLVRSL